MQRQRKKIPPTTKKNPKLSHLKSFQKPTSKKSVFDTSKKVLATAQKKACDCLLTNFWKIAFIELKSSKNRQSEEITFEKRVFFK